MAQCLQFAVGAKGAPAKLGFGLWQQVSVHKTEHCDSIDLRAVGGPIDCGSGEVSSALSLGS